MTESGSLKAHRTIPVSGILLEAVSLPWKDRYHYARALWAPGIALAALTLTEFYSSESLPPATQWLFLIGHLVLITILAVSCHRYVLLGPDSRPIATRWVWSRRSTVYLAWCCALLMVFWLCSIFVVWAMVSLLNVFRASAGLGALDMPISITLGGLGWLELPATVLSSYVFARLCLVLPAAATGRGYGTRRAWKLSSGNGWRLFVIVSMFPLALDYIAELAYFEIQSDAGAVVFASMEVVVLVIAVTALSLSYRQVERL